MDAARSQSSSNDRCAAVVTATTVHVVSITGEELWSWNYRRASRFLTGSEPMALSPLCDRVAMSGDPGYRYVWVAGRDTGAKAFQTVGTPLAVAFDVSGDYLAVSTGASRGYLKTRTLQAHWTGHLRDFPMRWPEQELPAPVRADLIDFSRSDLDRVLSVRPWGAWVSDSVSTNGQWRVLVQSPWDRRDLWQVLVFYGPEGHAFHGRWEKFSQRAHDLRLRSKRFPSFQPAGRSLACGLGEGIPREGGPFAAADARIRSLPRGL